MNHLRRIGRDARGQHELGGCRLAMNDNGLDDLLLGSGCLRQFVALARDRHEQHGEERKRKGEAVSWHDLHSGGKAELVNTEPYLLVGRERVEMDLTVVAQCVEVIKQRGPAVSVAELEVGAHAVGFVNVVAVVALGQICAAS